MTRPGFAGTYVRSIDHYLNFEGQMAAMVAVIPEATKLMNKMPEMMGREARFLPVSRPYKAN